MIKLATFSGKNQPSESEIKSFISRFLQSCKNLSADEVKVLKEKGKEWINDSLSTSSISQSPEAQTLFKAFINFGDAVLEEELVAETNNFLIECFEIVLKHIDITLKKQQIKKLRWK